MEKKELTEEEKEFIMALGKGPLRDNVELLKEIRLQILNGKTIEEIRNSFLSHLNHNPSSAVIMKVPEQEMREEPYTDKQNPNRNVRAEPEEEESLHEDIPDIHTQECEMENVSMATLETPIFEENQENKETLTPSEDFVTVQENEQDELKEQSPEPEEQSMEPEEQNSEQENSQQYDEVLRDIVSLKEEIQDMKIQNRQLEEEVKSLNRKILEIVESKREERQVPKPSKKSFFSFLPERKSDNYILRLLSNPKFTTEQITEIRLGVEADLDERQIKSFAKPELSCRQMKEIRLLYEMQNKKVK